MPDAVVERLRQDLPEHLRQLYDEVIAAADAHPGFAFALTQRFGRRPSGRARAGGGSKSPARHRRTPGVLDPYVLIRDSEPTLRTQLASLSVEQLKDIVAEHAMDSTKLAMKWKTPERLVELIVSTVRSRLAKGSAFRQPRLPQEAPE